MKKDLPFATSGSIGKGGVGKSTISCATAILDAFLGKKTLLADLDGCAAAEVLQLDTFSPNTISPTHIPNLFYAGLKDPVGLKAKAELGSFEKYIQQFPGDLGLVAYNDMPQEFYSLMTDIEGVYQMAVLTRILQQAKEDKYDSVVFDIEPNRGFKRLINTTAKVTDKMINLSRNNFFQLQKLGLVAPDIKKFLESDYIQRAQFFTNRLTETHDMLVHADYSLISIGETEPMNQALGPVSAIIDGIQGQIVNVIMNNAGRADAAAGEEEEVESNAQEWIKSKNDYYKKGYDAQLENVSHQHLKPFRPVAFKKIFHKPTMRSERINTLLEIGKELSQ